MRISDWSSDVCSSDLPVNGLPAPFASLPCCPFRLRLTVWLIPRAFSFASSGNSERRSGHDKLNFIPLRRVRSHHQSDRICHRSRSGSGSTTLASQDRKSTRLTPVTNAHLVCRLLLEKKKNKKKE